MSEKTDFESLAEEILEDLPEGVEASVDEVEGNLENLIAEYHVPREEARRQVRRNLLESAGLDEDDVSPEQQDNDEVVVNEINSPEEWVDLLGVKVVELWDPNSDAVAQVGLIGDETGKVKFTKWAKSNLPSLEEGEVYNLRNVVTDEYEGRFSVKLNRTTEIEPVENDVEVGDDSTEITGAIVDVQRGSGLIKRCPSGDCTRTLENGRCTEHGEVNDHEKDLRIKAIVDDGQEVHKAIFDREATEEIADITMAEAKEMAADALDTAVVTDDIEDSVVGYHYRVSGPDLGENLLVEDFEELNSQTDAEELLIKARSI